MAGKFNLIINARGSEKVKFGKLVIVCMLLYQLG